jgi:hypothetical protein
MLIVGGSRIKFKSPKKLLPTKTDPILKFDGKDFLSSLGVIELDTQTLSFFISSPTLNVGAYPYFLKKFFPLYMINLLNWRYN